jgi:hypothetical protein
VWRDLVPSFQAPHGPRAGGGYEAKGLLGLAHWARAVHDEAMLDRVKVGLRWIADVEAGWQGTGILGESWYVRDGRVISVVSQPHTWEHVLFYLAALETYGSTPSGSAQPTGSGHRARCARRSLVFRLHPGRRDRIVRATVYLDGRVIRRLRGRRLTVVRLLRRARGSHTVRIDTLTARGVRRRSVRRYDRCRKTRPRTRRVHPHRRHRAARNR